MRSSVLSAVVLVFLGGCVDFGLESRRFRCDDDPAICGEGWICGSDGFCTREGSAPADAATADDARAEEICGNDIDDDENGQTDCQDDACGPESCDDGNPCTMDTCESSGVCLHDDRDGVCGNGCTCEPDGMPSEVACGDREDNDGDGAVDCNDDDCPACMAGLMCCSDGSCRTTC